MDRLDGAGDILVWLPDGHEYLGPEDDGAIIARQAAELERLADALQQRGIDPQNP